MSLTRAISIVVDVVVGCVTATVTLILPVTVVIFVTVPMVESKFSQVTHNVCVCVPELLTQQNNQMEK